MCYPVHLLVQHGIEAQAAQGNQRVHGITTPFGQKKIH